MRETILADLDLEFGTAALDFNLDVQRGLSDALSDIEHLDDVKLNRLVHQQSEHLKILAAPASFDEELHLDDDTMIALMDALGSSADYVVMDLPHSWSPFIKRAVIQADEIVLVATPDLASLRNLKTMYDKLMALRNNDLPPKIILNQTGMNKRPEIPLKDFADIIGCPIDLNLAFEPQLFGEASNKGLMLDEIDKNSKTTEELTEFVNYLMGGIRVEQKKAGLLSGILGSLGSKKK